MKAKVLVLLSSYNGERFIEQQIESILSQTYPNLRILIRDDGSKDHTLQVLKKYDNNPRVKVVSGDNIGFIKSFEWLIVNSEEADFYAFADQDDVWLPIKIENAVKQLGKCNPEEPNLFFGNYDFYDENMEFSSHHKVPHYNLTFLNSLVDCAPLGFCSVFNKKVKKMIEENPPKYSCGHDWWVYMICAAFGSIIYDDQCYAKYRRHSGNVSDGGENFLKFQVWRFKKFFLDHYFENIRKQIREFSNYYYDSLTVENKKTIQMFTTDGIHPLNAVKKVCYPKRMRTGTADEVFLRIIMLIGQL